MENNEIKNRNKVEKRGNTEKYKAISGPISDFYSLKIKLRKKIRQCNATEKYTKLSEKGEINLELDQKKLHYRKC